MKGLKKRFWSRNKSFIL